LIHSFTIVGCNNIIQYNSSIMSSSTSKMSIQERIRAMNQTIERVVEQEDPGVPYEDATVSTMTMSIKEYDDDDDDDEEYDSDEDEAPQRRSVVDMWRKREVAASSSSSAPQPKPAAIRKWGQPQPKRIIKEEEEEKKESSQQQRAPVSVVDLMKQRTASAAAVPAPVSTTSRRIEPKKDLVIVDDDDCEDQITPRRQSSVASIWEKRGLARSPKIETITTEQEETEIPTPRRRSVTDKWAQSSSPVNLSTPPRPFRNKETADDQGYSGEAQEDEARLANEAATSTSHAISSASSAAALWKQRRQSAARKSPHAKKSSPSWVAAAAADTAPESEEEDDWLGAQPSSQVEPEWKSSARSEVSEARSSASSSAAMRWRERAAAARSPQHNNDEPSWKQSSRSDVGVASQYQSKQRTTPSPRSSLYQKATPPSPSATVRSWNNKKATPSPRVPSSPTQGRTMWTDDSMEEDDHVEEVQQQPAEQEESPDDEATNRQSNHSVAATSSAPWKNRAASQANDTGSVGGSSAAAFWNSRVPTKQRPVKAVVKKGGPVSPVEWGDKKNTESSSSQRQSAAAFWSKQISPTATAKPTWKSQQSKDTTPSWVKRKNDQEQEVTETPEQSIYKTPSSTNSISGASTSSWKNNRSSPSPVKYNTSGSGSSDAAAKPEWMNKLKKSSSREILKSANRSSSSSTKPAWMTPALRSTGRLTPTSLSKEPEGNDTEGNDDEQATCVSKSTSSEQTESPSKRRNPNWKNISIDMSSKETIDSHPVVTRQSTEETKPETKTPESSPRNTVESEVEGSEEVDVEVLEQEADDADDAAEVAQGIVEDFVEEDVAVDDSNAADEDAVEVPEYKSSTDESEPRVMRPAAYAMTAAGVVAAVACTQALNIDKENENLEENHSDEDEMETTAVSRGGLSDTTENNQPVQSSMAEEDATNDTKSHGSLEPSSNIEEEESRLSLPPSPSSAFETFDQTASTPKASTVERDNYLPVKFSNGADDFDPNRASFFSPNSEVSVASSKASTKKSSQTETFDPFISSSSSEDLVSQKKSGSFGQSSLEGQNISMEDVSEASMRGESNNSVVDNYLPTSLAQPSGFVDDFDVSRASFFSPNSSSDFSNTSKQVDSFDPFGVSSSSSEDVVSKELAASESVGKTNASFNPFDSCNEDNQPLEWSEAAPKSDVKETVQETETRKETVQETETRKETEQVKKSNAPRSANPMSLRQRAQIWKRRHKRQAASTQSVTEGNKVETTQSRTPQKTTAQAPSNAIDLAMQYASPARTNRVQESKGSESRLGARSIHSLLRNDTKAAENQDAGSISSNNSKQSASKQSGPQFSQRRVNVAQKYLSKPQTKSVDSAVSSDPDNVDNSSAGGASNCVLPEEGEHSAFEVVTDPDSATMNVSKIEPVTPDRNTEPQTESYHMDFENDQEQLRVDPSRSMTTCSQDSISLNLHTASSVTTQSSIGLSSNKVERSKDLPMDSEPSSPPKVKKGIPSVTEQMNSGFMNCSDGSIIDPDDFVNAYLPASLTPITPERSLGPGISPRRNSITRKSPKKVNRLRQKTEMLESTDPDGEKVPPKAPSAPPSSAPETAAPATPKKDTSSPNRKAKLSPASLTGLASRASRALSERRNRNNSSGRDIMKTGGDDQITAEPEDSHENTPETTQLPPPPTANTPKEMTQAEIQNSLRTKLKSQTSPVDRSGFVNRYQISDRYINDEQSRDSSRGGTMSATSFESETTYGASITDAESTAITMQRSTSGFSQSTGADTGAITMDSSFQDENPLTLSGIKDAYQSISMTSLANDFKKEMEATFNGMKDFTTGFSLNFPSEPPFKNNYPFRKPIGSLQSWRSIETAEEEVAIEVEYIGTRQDTDDEMELEKSNQRMKASPPAGQSSYEAKM